MKRFLCVVLLASFFVMLAGCASQHSAQSTESHSEDYAIPTETNTIQHSEKPSNTQPAFTNKYGTSTTKCAHTGCNNYIANSGDTNCCTDHSNRCLDCNAYIDEDAYWCVSCLVAAATPTCDACSKDATYTIEGITGQTEYYCTEHYNEILELLEWLENN